MDAGYWGNQSSYMAPIGGDPRSVGSGGIVSRSEARQPLVELFSAMQQGVANGVSQPLHGLFGGGPVIERPAFTPQVTPIAAPVAGNASSPYATPDPWRDVSTLPDRPKPKPTGTPTPDKAGQGIRAPQRGSAMQGGRATAQQVVRNLSQPKPRQQVVAPRQAAPTFAAPAQRAPAATPTRSSPAPAARNTATRIKR